MNTESVETNLTFLVSKYSTKFSNDDRENRQLRISLFWKTLPLKIFRKTITLFHIFFSLFSTRLPNNYCKPKQTGKFGNSSNPPAGHVSPHRRRTYRWCRWCRTCDARWAPSRCRVRTSTRAAWRRRRRRAAARTTPPSCWSPRSTSSTSCAPSACRPASCPAGTATQDTRLEV